MGVFHVFNIVQMVPNRATRHILPKFIFMKVGVWCNRKPENDFAGVVKIAFLEASFKSLCQGKQGL